MDTNEIFEDIKNLSMNLEIMLFMKNDNNTRWKLKPYNDIEKIIKEHYELFHENFCIRLKILHDAKKYNNSNRILKTLQVKLQMLDSLDSLIKLVFNSQNKHVQRTQNKIISENVIIESFSTNFV